MNKKHLLGAVLALACFFHVVAFGQAGSGFGAISGVVVDASGSSVPGASITITNDAKGIKRILETNGEGIFSAPALVPADGYEVSVKKTGFADYDAKGISLAVGQNIPLRVNLSVGAKVTQVDVSAEAALVDDVKTDVSQVINQTQIMDLPTNGRRVDNFVLATPGVAPDGAFGLLSFRGVAGHNNFLTDGNDTTNSFYNENAGRTRISSPISQEAVQEFQVISNNFAAEYGNAMGGVVNTITKSGSNSMHGTAYWFFRNRSLNARDRYGFLFGQPLNPQDIRHQAGFALGGPIKKDKIFYFFNYEATRRDFPAIALLTSASGNLFDAAGNFASGLAANKCPDPSVAAALQATPAQCATALNMLITRNFGTFSRTVTQDLGFGKIDYHLSDKNSLSLSTSALRWVSPHGIQATGAVFNTGNFVGNNADSTVRNVYGRAALTTIVSPTMVNELRFGFFKDRLFDPASPDFLYPGLGLAGLTVNSTTNLGVATSYPRLNPSENRYEIADNYSWVSGAHTMKFGVDFNANKDYVSQLANQFGSYSYSTLNNFARDFSGNTAGNKSWTTYSQTFGNPIVDLTTKTIGLYAQDQYRVNNNFVLSYGVRWDYTAIPQPTISNPDYPQTAVIPTTKGNFAPRVGLSYTLDKSRKTLFRAGYGIFYARYQTGLIETLLLSNGVYQKQITYNAATAAQLAAGPVYPTNLAGTSFNPPAGSVNILFADKNLRNPYTHQGNAGIERAINSTTSVSVAYNFSRAVRLYGVRDLNASLGAPITYTYSDPTTSGAFTVNTYRSRPDSRYRQVGQLENPGLAYYNGLAIQVNKRISHGLQGQIAYTWSHAIDLDQGGASNNIFFSSSPTSFDNGNFSAEKGSAANDVRHRFVVNTVWSPTFTSSKTAFARYFINNWQLSQVTTLQTPQPVISTVVISGNAFAGALASASLNGLGGSSNGLSTSRVPFQPLNNLRLDNIYRVDARLAKKLPFTERVTGYLQFEGFNIFNTPYDLSRNQQEYTLAGTTLTYRPTYGTPTGDAANPDGTTARRAQVSLRVTF